MSKEIWIAIISASTGILGALGVGKIIPALIEKWKKRQEYKLEEKINRTKEAAKLRNRRDKQIEQLTNRLAVLEDELDRYKAFETQTKATMRAMLPLMREIMKSHPDYIVLLDRLENNIMELKITPSDGE